MATLLKQVESNITETIYTCQKIEDNFEANRSQAVQINKVYELSKSLYTLLKKRHIWDEWNGFEDIDWSRWSNLSLQVIRAVKYKMSIEIELYYYNVENVTSNYVSNLENLKYKTLDSSDIQLITSFSKHVECVLNSMKQLEDRLQQVTNYVIVGRGDQKQYTKEIYKITKYFCPSHLKS